MFLAFYTETRIHYQIKLSNITKSHIFLKLRRLHGLGIPFYSTPTINKINLDKIIFLEKYDNKNLQNNP